MEREIGNEVESELNMCGCVYSIVTSTLSIEGSVVL